MNRPLRTEIRASTCPHDCPSTCALEVEVLDGRAIGRVRGAEDNLYTAGVICAKVARYAERIHHPDRLTHPMVRTGPKGSGQFAPISWDDALDLVAEKFLAAEAKHGSEAVWPYYYAGTMGLVMRDGINRLRHVKKYSGFHSTICVNPAWTGFIAGTGKLAGPDPREMAKSDCVVIWGTNPVNTQVNVMTHATRARKERGAKIVAIDIYQNGTMQQADLAVLVRPGTDGALACAVMHCLFRDGFADREYPREIHRRAARTGRASAHALARMGIAHHRLSGRDDRGLRRADRRTQAHLLSPRLRLRPLAQRHDQHACGKLHRGGARLMGAGRRRGVPQQRRDLSLEQDDHRGARRGRSRDPHARSVAHRSDSGRRAGRADQGVPVTALLDPEHQSDVGRARAGQGEARLCARRSVRLRARAVHDRDGADGRCRAARDHVHGARRHLSGRRAPIHPARAAS